MTDELKRKLELHKKWLNNADGGERADLRGADLRCADLSGADLNRADLRGANLNCADLSGADLNCADLIGANLRGADLNRADLSGADLNCADLIGANLRGADLIGADLRGANLIGANLNRADLNCADLIGANLRGANLNCADLIGANLRGADLRGANLNCADLSGAKNLLSAIDYLDANFERTVDGYIAYKTFGGQYAPPDKWVVKTGSIISETVNPDRCTDCGSGVNVAPIQWVKNNYNGDIWKCLIRWAWLPGVIVPYMTDGKIRCERVELIEAVK